MSSTTRSRFVYGNQTVVDQADFFQSDGFTRVTGLTTSQVTSQLFFNNVLQPWPLISGAGLNDIQIASGSVYWVEVPGSPGIYSVRFRPSALGYWRLVMTYAAGQQLVATDFDVIATPPTVDQGLKVSFFPPQ